METLETSYDYTGIIIFIGIILTSIGCILYGFLRKKTIFIWIGIVIFSLYIALIFLGAYMVGETMKDFDL